MKKTMLRVLEGLKKRNAEELGSNLVEYALLFSLVACAAAASVNTASRSMGKVFEQTAAMLAMAGYGSNPYNPAAPASPAAP